MPKIRGGKVKSMGGLKSSLKKGGGAGYLTRVSADSSLTVRFLTEPEGNWVQYYEHYDDTRKFYPCTDDCPGCADGDSPSQRYLANALDVADGKVIPLVMPKTLAASAVKKYEKYGTLLDRDYEIERSGSGFDTSYEITPEPPSKMNVSRFDLIDLEEILAAQLQDEDEDVEDEDESDDDEDETLAKFQKVAKKRAAKKPVVEDDEDEDDDDEDEEEESESLADLSRDALAKKSLKELKMIAHSQGATVADTKGLDVDALIDLIEGEADEDEDGAEDEVSEEDLKAMSLAELKQMAKSMKIKVAPGTRKEALVEMIWDNINIPF